MNETITTILNRRSIRSYKPEQIKAEELQLILQAGTYAPSAMNQQPWHFTVVQNPAIVQKISETIREIFLKSGNEHFENVAKSKNYNIFYKAPTLIIVSGDEKAIAPQCDCVLAMGNMFLAASSLGISSCWIHSLTHMVNSEEGKALISEIGIPEGYKIFSSGVFGYAAAAAPAAAPRKEDTIAIIK